MQGGINVGTADAARVVQVQADLSGLKVETSPTVLNAAELTPLPSPPPSQDKSILRSQAQLQGYTGDQCSNCNSMRMKVSGHCMVCEDCGTTTGCS